MCLKSQALAKPVYSLVFDILPGLANNAFFNSFTSTMSRKIQKVTLKISQNLNKTLDHTNSFILSPLGFLNANPIPHLKARVANYGLMDQIAALHWVQQNIALFGGDAGNVTMLGHGSGAACINFLMISPTVMPGKFRTLI